MGKTTRKRLLSLEELQELEEWFREQDKADGLNGEPTVWRQGRNVDDKDGSGGSYLNALD